MNEIRTPGPAEHGRGSFTGAERKPGPLGYARSIHRAVTDRVLPARREASEVSVSATTGSVATPIEPSNAIANFVLDKVPRWDRLHAETQAEGEVVFKRELATALQGEEVDKKVVGTGNSQAQLIKGHPELLVKRIYTNHGDVEEADRILAQRESEHTGMKTHLGDLIPPTEFVVVHGTDFGDPSTRFINDREYLVVQEPVKGIQFSDYDTAEYTMKQIAAKGVRPQLRTRMDQFAERYVKLYEATGWLPECQFFVNPEEGSVHVVDTNNPMTFVGFNQDNRLPSLSDNPEAVTTPQAYVDLITHRLPQYQDLAGTPWEQIRGQFKPNSNRFKRTRRDAAQDQGPLPAEDIHLTLPHFRFKRLN